MKKPQLKMEVAIQAIIEITRHIMIYATPDAAEEFREFGELRPRSNAPNLYDLFVDSRYDFVEVVAYIQDYGK